MGGLTTISLGALVVFHLAFGLGNLLKVLQSLERLLTDFKLNLTFLRSRPMILQLIWSVKEPQELERLQLRSYLRVSLPAGKSHNIFGGDYLTGCCPLPVLKSG